MEEAVNSVTANKDRPRRSRLLRLVVLLGAIGAIGASMPDHAHADYGVIQCVPPVVPYTDAGKVAFGPYSIWGTNECGSGSLFGLRLYTGSNTGWTANGAGLAWRFSAPAETHFTTANTSVHYGNDGGFAAASFSDGAPPFNVFSNCATPSSCWATASTNGATLFEIRLQCFKSPNCHSDWSYAWTTSFTAAVHDGSPPAIAAGGSLLSGAFVHGVQTLDATATDAGGGARSVRVSVNGISSRSIDFCPPNYAGAVHRAQALPQLVQPAAFHRHPEGSRLDEWAERRCHLLDGCRWQSLLIMRSADRERRQLMPGIRGYRSCRPRRRRGPRRPAQGAGCGHFQCPAGDSWFAERRSGPPRCGWNSLHLRDGRPARCITRADQLRNDAGERALCNPTRRGPLTPARPRVPLQRSGARRAGETRLDGSSPLSRLRGRASRTAMRRASGGVCQAPMPTGERWQCRPGWAASGAPSSSCGPSLMAGSVAGTALPKRLVAFDTSSVPW